MSSVLVTGASGLIGRQVIAQLADDRAERSTIVAMDVRDVPTADRIDGITYVTGDIRDETIGDVFVEHGIDTVVHLAAIVTPGKDSTRELEYSIDVEGSRNVLDACLAAGVTQLVYTSSGAAYGYHADNPVPLCEDHDLRGNPEFAYSDHKRLVEEMLARARAEHPELAQLIFRPGTILGETVENPITAIFDRPVVTGVRGSDSPFVIIWDTDVAAAIVKGIRERRSGIYNLAGDGTVSLSDIAKRLGKPYVTVPASVLSGTLAVANRMRLTQLGPEQVRFLRYRPVLDNRRLREEFGFTPSRTSVECFEAFQAARQRTNETQVRTAADGRLRVVITGGAGGIGAALARRYAAQGAHVAILDLEAAEPVPDGLALVCDVTDETACASAIESVVESFGGIDVLVNNAGLTHMSTFGDTSTAVLRRVMDVNYFGAVHCTKAALPALLESRGQVIALSSVAGFAPLYGRTGYCASKHALHGFLNTLRAEYRDEGLRVMLACPSFVDTAIGEHALGGDGSRVGVDSRTGVKDPMSPDDVAAAIVEAAAKDRRVLLVPAESRLSWWVSRVSPRLYERLMLRRAG